MQRGDYKSSLHYLALQPGHSGVSFEDFLLYFSNKDIGKLDLAISETILRNAFHKRLGLFYNHNIITCLGEFKLICTRNLSIQKCNCSGLFDKCTVPIPDVSIGIIVNFCVNSSS